eukprot:1702167-Heterocapsa_arctica.AAC.1
MGIGDATALAGLAPERWEFIAAELGDANLGNLGVLVSISLATLWARRWMQESEAGLSPIALAQLSLVYDAAGPGSARNWSSWQSGDFAGVASTASCCGVHGGRVLLSGLASDRDGWRPGVRQEGARLSDERCATCARGSRRCSAKRPCARGDLGPLACALGTSRFWAAPAVGM